jgi:hypothetical protein
MECAVHPGVETSQACAACKKSACDKCATFTIAGEPCCEACGTAEEDRARWLGSAMIALVGVGYLATLAIGVLIWKTRPYVGGIAAVVAIALGRVMQMFIRPSAAKRRLVTTRSG